MCQTNDGFKIAEADLKQRGSGDLIGTAQSGANKYVEDMLNDPELFIKAESLVKKYESKNYGRFLMAEYEEHLKMSEEYNKKKKR